ncbi:fatty acid desaturase [Roseisalinus antarcticus]|uniref:Fatty acid desaturase n=1 Tax=Roseisalinus antarcticus TaxID=254357 RepID=A0A1Y5RY31_9RHOB|nr:fatty acid desaturase [Roseisalinus antarcticus]SLN28297.1 Fatty acid desaturase [Roseisalinus antarcticus]
MSDARFDEWPTIGLLVVCYALWALAVLWLSSVSPWLSVPAVAVTVSLHTSLSHEAMHGHPFRNPRLNAALVWPALMLAVPYLRFRDTHLAHHHDAMLTDPYDDPESNYLDPARWTRMPGWLRWLRRVNNTLAGRMTLGPLLGQIAFMAGDWRNRRDRAVIAGWLWHVPAAAVVLAAVWLSPMPVWAYLLAAYLAVSLQKIRSFLEHRAHEATRARTVIIEDRGPLALLFLNNNLHVVHHMHPRVPWFRLPKVYARNPGRYLTVNEGYRYASYAEVFRRYFWKAKDPVPHPLWRI